MLQLIGARTRLLARRVRMAAGVFRQPPSHPPGHFYSPIPSVADVRARTDSIFTLPPTLPGIDLRLEGQLALVHELGPYLAEQPFRAEKQEGLRCYFHNRYFGEGDALVLFGMLRHLRPRRLVEVGSGHSSALILDTNERFLDGKLECTFVEPYPERLHRLLAPDDPARQRIVAAPVQDVELSVFEELEAGDFLFVDSSHVSKIGSDVNFLFFEVLPRLSPGVVVHLHDIFYPFEYPREWTLGGKAWNEVYVTRAFLTFNEQFRIELFNSYLKKFHRKDVAAVMPLWDRNPGASLWLRRVD
jgi:Methyltransferase domain